MEKVTFWSGGYYCCVSLRSHLLSTFRQLSASCCRPLICWFVEQSAASFLALCLMESTYIRSWMWCWWYIYIYDVNWVRRELYRDQNALGCCFFSPSLFCDHKSLFLSNIRNLLFVVVSFCSCSQWRRFLSTKKKTEKKRINDNSFVWVKFCACIDNTLTQVSGERTIRCCCVTIERRSMRIQCTRTRTPYTHSIRQKLWYFIYSIQSEVIMRTARNQN